MIYDPITRQSLTFVGRYPPQSHAHDQFVGRISGNYRFVRVRYGEHLPGFSGGFPVGHERDLEINSMVADDGSLEIQRAYDAAPEIGEDASEDQDDDHNPYENARFNVQSQRQESGERW